MSSKGEFTDKTCVIEAVTFASLGNETSDAAVPARQKGRCRTKCRVHVWAGAAARHLQAMKRQWYRSRKGSNCLRQWDGHGKSPVNGEESPVVDGEEGPRSAGAG